MRNSYYDFADSLKVGQIIKACLVKRFNLSALSGLVPAYDDNGKPELVKAQRFLIKTVHPHIVQLSAYYNNRLYEAWVNKKDLWQEGEHCLVYPIRSRLCDD